MTELFVAAVLSWSVIDGDTIDVRALVWPNHIAEERLRLVRIDAPEKNAGARCERALAAAATEWTGAQLAAARSIVVKAQAKRDSFGRILGDVIVDGVSLSDAGLAAGVFRPFVRPRAPWC